MLGQVGGLVLLVIGRGPDPSVVAGVGVVGGVGLSTDVGMGLVVDDAAEGEVETAEVGAGLSVLRTGFSMTGGTEIFEVGVGLVVVVSGLVT